VTAGIPKNFLGPLCSRVLQSAQARVVGGEYTAVWAQDSVKVVWRSGRLSGCLEGVVAGLVAELCVQSVVCLHIPAAEGNM